MVSLFRFQMTRKDPPSFRLSSSGAANAIETIIIMERSTYCTESIKLPLLGRHDIVAGAGIEIGDQWARVRSASAAARRYAWS